MGKTSPTEVQLIDAFLELRTTKEKLTIKRIAQHAGVSKSSAYRSEGFLRLYREALAAKTHADPEITSPRLSTNPSAEFESISKENHQLKMRITELMKENDALMSLLLKNS